MATDAVEIETRQIEGMIAVVAERHRQDQALVAIADTVSTKLARVRGLREHAVVPFAGRLQAAEIHGQDLAAALALGSAMVELNTARDILRLALERLGEKA